MDERLMTQEILTLIKKFIFIKVEWSSIN